jgi:hypothetical protein
LILVAALATQILFYRAGAPVVDDFSSLRTAADAARELPSTAAVFAYKTHGYSFSFYDGRTIFRVRSADAAATVLTGDRPAALLTKTRYLAKIQQQLTQPVSVWWEGPSGRVLIANRAPLRTAAIRMLPPTRESAGHTASPRS